MRRAKSRPAARDIPECDDDDDAHTKVARRLAIDLLYMCGACCVCVCLKTDSTECDDGDCCECYG